jgi:hypothetical protein
MGTLVHEGRHFESEADTFDHASGLEYFNALVGKDPEKARSNADNFSFFCAMGHGGDTHFKTLLGSSFDFHEDCDLILLVAPSFEGGRGLKIHVLTQLSSNHHYSFVSVMAIQIGEDILEVAGHGD